MTDKMTKGSLDVAFLESASLPASAGMQNLESEDYANAKLLLCQAMTPHRSRSSDVYIEGLKEGDFFNSINRTIYGSKVEVIPIDVGKPYAMEYDNNGKVVDFNVPLDDPRLQGQRDDNGDYHPAKAKRQLDYVCLLIPSEGEPDVILWTAKGSGRGTAKQINVASRAPLTIGGKRVPNPPMFARAFPFQSTQSRGENNNFVIQMGLPRLVTKGEFNVCKELYEELQANKRAMGGDANDDVPF